MTLTAIRTPRPLKARCVFHSAKAGLDYCELQERIVEGRCPCGSCELCCPNCGDTLSHFEGNLVCNKCLDWAYNYDGSRAYQLVADVEVDLDS